MKLLKLDADLFVNLDRVGSIKTRDLGNEKVQILFYVGDGQVCADINKDRAEQILRHFQLMDATN